MARLLGLDPVPEDEEPRLKLFLKAGRQMAGRLEEKFVFFVGVSLAAHLILFGLLLLRGPSQAAVPVSRAASNAAVVSRVIRDLARESVPNAARGKAVPAESVEATAKALSEAFSFDPKLTERDIAEIIRNLVKISSESGEGSGRATLPNPEQLGRLIDLLKQRKGLSLASGDSLVMGKSAPDGKVELYKLDRTSLETLKRLEEEAKRTEPDAQPESGFLTASAARGPGSIPAEYYFRTSPCEEMMAQGAQLFTVFRGFPDLAGRRQESAAKARAGAPTAAANRPAAPAFFYLVSGPPPQSERREGVTLKLSDAERNRILDELMALKESEQLAAFKSRFLDVYDLDRADLANLTRDFLFSNMNNVFFVTDPFSSAFDEIEEIYYKRAVGDFLFSYARRSPKTRVGNEILFYLASFYDFERRTLENLFRAQREAKDVIDGNRRGPATYQPTLKALVLNRIYLDVHQLAGDMHLPLESLLDQYVRRQEEVYATLVESGGEFKNRALYAWGRMLWAEGRFDLALGKWKQVDPTFPLNSPTFWGSMGYIERFGLENSIKFVDDRLAGESLKDQLALLERHLKFHTWQKRQD